MSLNLNFFYLFFLIWQVVFSLEVDFAGQADGPVESTFCSGWVGGQEDTPRPGPGLPRGHLDRGNTCRAPAQTWSSTLTHHHTHAKHAAQLDTLVVVPA